MGISWITRDPIIDSEGTECEWAGVQGKSSFIQ